ncbi:MAG: hypothetical protein OD918_04230 [Gammaproteobacteria bacterium]
MKSNTDQLQRFREENGKLCEALETRDRHIALLRAQCSRFADFFRDIISDEPDEDLAQTDPDKYRETKKLRDCALEAIEQLGCEDFQDKDAGLMQVSKRQHAESARRVLLDRFPQLRDPTALNRFFDIARTAAHKFGFSEKEFSEITDNRFFVLLYFAACHGHVRDDDAGDDDVQLH